MSESLQQRFHFRGCEFKHPSRDVYPWQQILFTLSNKAARCFVPLAAEHLSRVTTCSITREQEKKEKCFPPLHFRPNWTVENRSDFLWRNANISDAAGLRLQAPSRVRLHQDSQRSFVSSQLCVTLTKPALISQQNMTWSNVTIAAQRTPSLTVPASASPNYTAALSKQAEGLVHAHECALHRGRVLGGHRLVLRAALPATFLK